MNHFFAIEISADTRHSVAAYSDHWRTQLGVRHDLHWLNPSDYHITLKFLGDTPRDEALLLSGEAQRIAHRYGPLQVRQAQTGAFPTLEKPRVLWAGVARNFELESLAGALDRLAAAAGYPPERRPYHPHITLARAAGRPVAPAIPNELLFVPWDARGFVLMEIGPPKETEDNGRIRYNTVQVFPFSK